MRLNSLRSRSEEGQTLVLFALCGFVLMGALALALDVGYLLSERRAAQAAADAAALAGARAMVAGETNSGITTTAQNFARANGLPSDAASSAISVNIAGDRWDGTVTVDLDMDVQRFFLGAIYTGPWEVSAHAVAEITDKADANYVLQARQEPGLSITGGIEVTATNGSIISNYDIETDGDSSIVVTDGFIDATGTIEPASGWDAPWGIREKRAPAKDDFASYARPPKPAGPPITGTYRCKMSAYADSEPLDDECIFYPGWYRNANIRIWDPTEFKPGLYYFENSSITVRSTNGRIEGTDVNFYFTGNPMQSFIDPQNGSLYLTATDWSDNPDELIIHHDYRDIVIWFDMCPGPDFNAQGDQEFFLGGVLYAPCSELYLHGNPFGETINGIVIGGHVHLQGSTEMIITYVPYAPVESYEVYLIE